MDGIIALGHFCETHGPCVILCTQRCSSEPQQLPHSRTVPWCEACQSVQLDQAFVSKDEKACYVTTRTPLKQDLAFLLKQATVRSLSCEESNKEGGTLYFGDSERGHVISHTFTVNDSLARGFQRKYCILVFMWDKVHLLNSWPFLVKNIKEISTDLQQKATKINDTEQAQRPQRAVRQAQRSPNNNTRSLPQLTGEPAVFAHIHLWFCWLLSTETVTEKRFIGPPLPKKCEADELRKLAQEMDAECFRKACYCILTGIRLEVNEANVLNALRQLLPENMPLPTSGDKCLLLKENDKWKVQWSGCLPIKLPTLQTTAEKALKDSKMPLEALEYYLTASIMQWLHNARSLVWAPTQDQKLLQSLGVQKHDLPLLAYWMSHCLPEKQQNK